MKIRPAVQSIPQAETAGRAFPSPGRIMVWIVGVVCMCIVPLAGGCGNPTVATNANPITHPKRWAGTWNEAYPLVGTRKIIHLVELNGGLAGTTSTPAIPNGTPYTMRIPFSISRITEIDPDTLKIETSEFGTITVKFVMGENGEAASMLEQPAPQYGGVFKKQ